MSRSFAYVRNASENDTEGCDVPGWVRAELEVEGEWVWLIDECYPENRYKVHCRAIYEQVQPTVDHAVELMRRWRRRFGVLATLRAQHWRDGEE